MTTRAGLVGLLTGMVATAILFIINRSVSWDWFTITPSVLMILGGGYLAGHRSGTIRPWRSSALGGLAGGLAGSLVFCLFGAAMVGRAERVHSELATVRQTYTAFLFCFGGGLGLGALGGWLARPFGNGQ